MNEREDFDNALLTVRFTGENINTSGVNIYDFATTLLSTQRIIHKAYLAMEGRLTKGAYPSKEEREKLALQIGERRRQSDAFALVPVLTDQVIQSYMVDVIRYVFNGIVGYYLKDVLDRVKRTENENSQFFIGAIHADTVNLISRIDASGGVDSISFGSPQLGKDTIASFSQENKDYVNSLKNEIYYGARQTIEGNVYRMYPRGKFVTIRREKKPNVNITLADDDFNTIRYCKVEYPKVIFRGLPIYRFGIETRDITEFEADEIEVLNS